MRKLMNVKTALLFGLVVAGLSMFGTVNKVEARPNFKNIWAETYPNSPMLIAKKCGICHPGKSKKEKSDYGEAVFEALGKKRKATDKEVIVKALKAAEAKPTSVEGKTYGDFIKADEMPPTKKSE